LRDRHFRVSTPTTDKLARKIQVSVNLIALPSIRAKLVAKLNRPLRYPAADKRWSQYVSTAARLRRTTMAMSAEIKRLLSDS
jgi:hypothetical protein